MARTRGSNNDIKRQLPKRVLPLTISRAFGQKSPLVDTDLQAFLAHCLSTERWETYTVEERQQILECMPPSRRQNLEPVNGDTPERDISDRPSAPKVPLSSDILQQGTGLNGVSCIPPDFSDIDTDTYVKRAIARFQRDLGDGYYEKTWQDKARRAHQERMDGKFDDYVKQHAEEMFEDDGSLDEGNGEEKDDLAHFSEDSEYLEASRTSGRGRGRPRKTR